MSIFRSNKKWMIIIILFLLILTGVRILWTDFLTTLDYPESPTAKEGMLDLRDVDFNRYQTLPLNGEWEFYPSTFLIPNDSQAIDNHSTGAVTLNVPGSWNEAFAQNQHSYQFGTYRLQILLNQDIRQNFSLKISKIGNASAVYVNGELLKRSGIPSREESTHLAWNIPYSVTIPPGTEQIDLVIQVSNHAGKSGIYKPIRFGTTPAIQARNLLFVGLQVFLCVIFLIHCLYSLILYMLGEKNKSLIYFSLLIFCATVSVLVSDDSLLFQWMDVSYEWYIKVAFLTYLGIASFIPPLANSLFPGYIHKKWILAFRYYCVCFALFLFISPAWVILAIVRVLLFVALSMSVLLCAYILNRAVREKEDVFYLILSILSIGVNIIWTNRMHSAPEKELLHYPFDLMIAVFAFAAFWFKRFFRVTNDTKMLAERLQLEDKKKDTFLVNTSHELRNPLQVISNVIQVILDDEKNSIPFEHMKRLNLVNQVSKRMSLMVEDLIDITRLKERTIPLQLQAMHIHSVIYGVIDMISYMVEEKNVQFQVYIEETNPAVMADENRVIQILFNLMHNAVKFTEEGTITVRAVKKVNTVEISIEDTGVGIPVKILPTIFDPYVQDPNVASVTGGFGIGLSVCKQLVELQGGTIAVESTPGQGSRFMFSLPLADSKVSGKIKPPILNVNNSNSILVAATLEDSLELARTHSGKHTARILIVDDDPVNIHVYKQTLEPDGYAITSATNAEQAIKNLENNRFDLVITDVMMPKISGYELTRIIRERFSISELPILLLTARSRSEDVMTGFSVGANDYVKKPVDAWEFRGRVKALTELKWSAEEHLRLESAWLQSQIKPHFLFNVLNSIMALSIIDVEKMKKLLNEFSNYLRLSFDFNNVEPLVPLEKELSLVKSYLYIEKERFGDRLKVKWDIELGVYCYIPPLTIQPLIENAIKHGIMEKAEGGLITIRITKTMEGIEVLVKDNGIGMSKKQWMANERKIGAGGVGLENIDRRLKQHYGEGLTVQSASEGTTVKFYIPYPTDR